MAFLHTNYLTGNDTTGDGSASLPYKTIFKALGVAVSDTTIKVYGGQWAALSGDFTFTYGSQTVNTANNQTGIIQVDDILSWEDSQFGFEKFFMKVTAVGTTTITLANYWPGPTQTVAGSNVKRIDAYPYTTTGTSYFETWNTTAIQPAGRTGIVISGGWSSDFTTQGGWTVVRKTAVAANASGNAGFITNTTNGLGNWGANLVFDKFIMHSLATAVNLFSATGTSFAVKRWAAVRTTTNAFFAGAATYGYGLYQASAGEPVELYLTGSTYNSFLAYANANITGEPRPSECKLTIWNNASSQASGSAPSSLLVGSYTLTPAKPIFNNTYNLRTIENQSYVGASYPLVNAANSGVQIYASAINFYCNTPLNIGITPGAGYSFVVKSIGLTGPQAQKSSYNFAGSVNGSNPILDVDGAGININSNYVGFANLGVTYSDSNYGGLNRATTIYQPSAGGIKDTEGLKTWDVWGTTYYKDAANDWLKIYPASTYGVGATGDTLWAFAGVKDKPTSTFTATFSFKTDYPNKWTAIGVAYGPANSQLITSPISPTGTFANYSITINPADYADWDTGFPIYVGLKFLSPNPYTLDPVPVGYLRSVTFS